MYIHGLYIPTAKKMLKSEVDHTYFNAGVHAPLIINTSYRKQVSKEVFHNAVKRSSKFYSQNNNKINEAKSDTGELS